MKRKPKHTYMDQGIHTLEELQARKQKLIRKIHRHEQVIKNDYTELVDTLTLRNLLTTIAEEVIATNIAVQQAYTILKPLVLRLFKKRKSGDGSEKRVKSGRKNPGHLSGTGEPG